MRIKANINSSSVDSKTFTGKEIANREGIYECINAQGWDAWEGGIIIVITTNEKARLYIDPRTNNVTGAVNCWFSESWLYKEYNKEVTVTFSPN